MYNILMWVLLLVVSFIGVMLFYILFGKVGLFAWTGVAMILANIQIQKFIILFGVLTTVANIMYATTFLITDILSEIYGEKESRRAVWIGFLVMLVMTFIMYLSLKFKPAPIDKAQIHLQAIFGIMPRIMLGSVIAYVISQNHDVWAFHFWKRKTNGKHLWLRNNASTMISQFIDTMIFMVIAFIGTMSFKIILTIGITTYIFKWAAATADTPFVYLARYLNKKGYVNIVDKMIKKA